MPFWLHNFPRQFVAALVSVVIVAVAIGAGLPASHAKGASTSCPSYAYSNIQQYVAKVHGHVVGLVQVNAIANQPGLDSLNNKTDAATGTPCCSGYCSPAYSLPDRGIEALAPSDGDDWPIVVQLVISAEPGSFKKPPRIAPDTFARA